MIGKAKPATKAEARYTPSHGSSPEYCGICTHFKPPSECEVVEGAVHSQGWCKFFKGTKQHG